MTDTKTLGPRELAVILKKGVDTIKTDSRRRPETLPPRLKIPGSNRLLWLESDVVAWLQACRTGDKSDPA
jgi:predicted DNA-binding transcriptional regulator AlpA